MQQHQHHQRGREQWSGGARTAHRETPAGSLALAARLERLLGERQDLVRHLDALAPTDGAWDQVEQRLQAITDEHERLLHALAAVVPPDATVV